MKFSLLLAILASVALFTSRATAGGPSYFVEKYTETQSEIAYVPDIALGMLKLKVSKRTIPLYRVMENFGSNKYIEIKLGKSGTQKQYSITGIGTPGNLATLNLITPSWDSRSYSFGGTPPKTSKSRLFHQEIPLFLASARRTGYLHGKRYFANLPAPSLGFPSGTFAVELTNFSGAAVEYNTSIFGDSFSTIKISAVPAISYTKMLYKEPTVTRNFITYNRYTLEHAVAIVIRELEKAGYVGVAAL
jgi:hypothetical protein